MKFYFLRTLDALQLAVAIGLKEAKPVFVCSGNRHEKSTNQSPSQGF